MGVVGGVGAIGVIGVVIRGGEAMLMSRWVLLVGILCRDDAGLCFWGSSDDQYRERKIGPVLQ
jgi:hypothetical protein